MTKEKTQDNSTYHLKLFVAGNETNSAGAKRIVEEVCSTYLKDNFNLKIIDVYENYQAALDYKVIVVPTLMVDSSQIKITIAGSLIDKDNLKKTLGLSTKEKSDGNR